jgi:hypothetical protein
MIEELDIKNLTSNFLFANTPGFLYKKFRQNRSIEEISKNYSTKEILDSLNEILKTENLDLNQLVMCNALLISLTLKDDFGSLDALKSIDLSKLEWGNQIRNIYINTRRATNVIEPKITYGELIPDAIKTSSPSKVTTKNAINIEITKV